MSIRETSGYESGNELRGQIGLQFFAEGEGSTDGANTDGDFGSDFEAGLFGDTLENQQGAEQSGGESADGGLENQQSDGQQGEPGVKQPPEGAAQQGGQSPAAQQEPSAAQQPQLVPLTYNGQQIMLPQTAVKELQSVLGADPIALLQKGMNYEKKNSREMAVLEQFAQASGMNVQQYVQQLEQMREEQLLQTEIEKAREEFPDTPNAALKWIAQQRVSATKAQARQRELQQMQEVREGQSRVHQMVAQSQQQAKVKAWDDYETIAGVHKPEDIPPRVMELVQQEGMTPVAAHWRYQAEQANQKITNMEKQTKNREQSAGSMAGAGGDISDPFLRGFLNG